MAQQIIALDVGRERCYVACVEASLRRAALGAVRCITYAPDLPAAELWATIAAELPGGLDALVVGVDLRGTSVRALEFPFVDLRRAQSAVDFELEGQIPYAIDEVASTWHVTERGGGRTQLLAAITPRAPLQAQLATMAAAGLEPRALAVPGAALAEYGAASSTEAEAVVSVGAQHTHVTVVRGGLRATRTLRVGGDDVDRAVARAFGVPLAQAREAKHAEARLLPGDPDEGALPADVRRLSAAVAEGLLPLLSALSATFKALPPADMPTRLRLTGGLSRLPGLPAFLQARLGLPVALLDIRGATESLPGSDAPVGPEYAVALGMALALLRHGRELPLNFRRGALAYHGDIALYRGQFTRLVLGAAAVIALAIMASTVRYSLLVAEEAELDRGFSTATERIVGRAIAEPAVALATLRQAPGADGVVIPSYSAASLLEMMSRAVSADVDVQFDELDLRVDATGGQPERLTGKGEAQSFETTEQLRTMLKRDVCVQEAEVSKLRKTHNGGRVEFSLLVRVACPAGVQPGTQQTAAAAVVAAPSGAPAAAPAAEPVP